MRRTLRVYQCRWEKSEWVVAATSRAVAAELIGMPLHQMNEYGQLCTHVVARALALSGPGSVWCRRRCKDPWVMAAPPEIASHGSEGFTPGAEHPLTGGASADACGDPDAPSARAAAPPSAR